ncbi:MAG: alpha-glucosidase [Granulosicoccus sp.]
MTQSKAPWWKAATGYQIYPRSFCDSNGDGIGDIPGIISKLDHLQDLGIGFIWLSPVYASPMRDNGYDISDYYDIANEFGTLADFDQLVDEARTRDIRIVMDLVVNHCSVDHDWFQKACKTRNCPEHDLFYWRDPCSENEGPPDDQCACFGGSAWTWVESVGQYYLGFFGPQQPDLNWHNPQLRQRIYDMMNWWLDKGIGGFRMDVIELIGKDLDKRHYFEGPDMHAFIQEMHLKTLAGRDIMTVGESWAVTPDNALDYCAKDRLELDMVFNFNHIQAGWDPVKGRFGPSRFDLVAHKKIMNDWQMALAHDGWNSLYLSNHDLPRAVSQYGDDKLYRERSAKMLALSNYLMKGTPFIFQGEEIGMTNVTYERIEQFRDIETLGQYQDRIASGESEADFVAAANQNGRDNARTPMQWNSTNMAGFSQGEPWIDVNSNYVDVNVVSDRDNPDGVFQFYQKLIALRRSNMTIQEGTYTPLEEYHPQIFAYYRQLDDERIFIFANYSNQVVTIQTPKGLNHITEILLSNMEVPELNSDEIEFAPYQAFAIATK